MPIYQYKCEACSCEFELRKNFSDDSNHITCPDCGKKAHRVFIPTAIIFKGSGFYVTDYPGNATLPSGDVGKEKGQEKVKKEIAEVTKPSKSTEIPQKKG